MSTPSSTRRIVLFACAAAVLANAAAHSQNPGGGPASSTAGGGTRPTTIGTGPTPTTGGSAANNAPGTTSLAGMDAARRQRQLEYFAQETRKKNSADAEKLLALAKELNSTSEEPSRGAPTQADMKKIEEIEKLAHRVKERLTAP